MTSTTPGPRPDNPNFREAPRRGEGFVQCDHSRAGQDLELEDVGRDDVGQRQGVLAEETRQGGVDVEPAAPRGAPGAAPATIPVPHDRIAGVERPGVGRLDPRDRVKHRRPGLRRPQVAGEHRVTGPEQAARRQAVHHRAQVLGGEDLAGEVLVTGVIGELQGVQRPDLETQALQGKNGRRVADVAIGHMGLNRKDVHGFVKGRRLLPPSLPQAAHRL